MLTTSGPIGVIPALHHESSNNPMENRAFITFSFWSFAQFHEIRHCFVNDLAEQSKRDVAFSFVANFDLEPNLVRDFRPRTFAILD